jgi:hypothetical protein
MRATGYEERCSSFLRTPIRGTRFPTDNSPWCLRITAGRNARVDVLLVGGEDIVFAPQAVLHHLVFANTDQGRERRSGSPGPTPFPLMQ